MSRKNGSVSVALGVAAILFLAAPGRGHAADTSSGERPSDTLKRLVELRDDFAAQIRHEGFVPRLPPPEIVLDNPPSYGTFENEKNLLHIAEWSKLAPQQQERFGRIATRMNKGQTGEQVFEEGVHRWVFVHELGHWWQTCEKMTGKNHYSVEYGANRIAAAFWRLKDPAYMVRTEDRMAAGKSTLQSPVPPGQDMRTYFDENYDTLGPTPGYIWYQYSMVQEVQKEQPLPSFKQALETPAFP